MARISFGLVLTGKSRGEAQLLISSETPPRGAQLSSVSDPKLCWASLTQTIPFPCWINDTNNTEINNSQFHLEHLLLRGHQFPDVITNFQMLSPHPTAPEPWSTVHAPRSSFPSLLSPYQCCASGYQPDPNMRKMLILWSDNSVISWCFFSCVCPVS